MGFYSGLIDYLQISTEPFGAGSEGLDVVTIFATSEPSVFLYGDGSLWADTDDELLYYLQEQLWFLDSRNTIWSETEPLLPDLPDGFMWLKRSEKILKVYSGSTFIVYTGGTLVTTYSDAPTPSTVGKVEGDYWYNYDASRQYLYRYDAVNDAWDDVTDLPGYKVSYSEPVGSHPVNTLWIDKVAETIIEWTGAEWIDHVPGWVFEGVVPDTAPEPPAPLITISTPEITVDWFGFVFESQVGNLQVSPKLPTVDGYNVAINAPAGAITVVGQGSFPTAVAIADVPVISLDGVSPIIAIGMVVPTAVIEISPFFADVTGFNRIVSPIVSSIFLSAPPPYVLKKTGPIILFGEVVAGDCPNIVLEGAPDAFIGAVMEPAPETIAFSAGDGLTLTGTVLVEVQPPASNIEIHTREVTLTVADFIASESAVIKATIPFFLLQGSDGGDLSAELPSLKLVGEMRANIVSSFKAILPRLDIQFTSGGSMEAKLILLECLLAGHTDYISDLEVMMPSLSLLMHSTHGGPNDISGVLPSIRLAIKAFTGEVASLDALLPALQIECRAVVGIVADLEAMLPAFKIRMEGMRTGENSLDLELKRLELFMTEIERLSTILRHVRGEIR